MSLRKVCIRFFVILRGFFFSAVYCMMRKQPFSSIHSFIVTRRRRTRCSTSAAVRRFPPRDPLDPRLWCRRRLSLSRRRRRRESRRRFFSSERRRQKKETFHSTTSSFSFVTSEETKISSHDWNDARVQPATTTRALQAPVRATTTTTSPHRPPPRRWPPSPRTPRPRLPPPRQTALVSPSVSSRRTFSVLTFCRSPGTSAGCAR